MDLRDFSERESLVSARDDEGILDWIVISVRRGWTPKEVLVWIFPYFGGLLFDMALDVACSA